MKFDALIMAGGKGERLGLKTEKPLVEFNGRPMVYRVIRGLKESGVINEIYATVTRDSPETERYLKRHGVLTMQTPGNGFVADLQYFMEGICLGNVFVVSADLPMLEPEIISYLAKKYEEMGVKNLAVNIPEERFIGTGFKPTMVIDGMVPSGVNILDFRDPSEETSLTSNDIRMAANINTRSDLEAAKSFYEMKNNG